MIHSHRDLDKEAMMWAPEHMLVCLFICLQVRVLFYTG